MKREDFRTYLDRLLPLEGGGDFCQNGLQVEGKQQIHRVATAVSASYDTLQKAAQLQVDALIVHHGLFWQRDSHVIEGVKKKKLQLLFENGISLFAYHLPLDIHRKVGNNWAAAAEMGWRDLAPFGVLDKMAIGVRGKIAPCEREAFADLLEKYYGHPAACAFGGRQKIETVALVSGGAHKLIVEAAKEGIDAFITGSFDEPVWHLAFEEKINFFALGHSATERVGPIALANYLREALKIETLFIDVPNPF